jgi:hypothetical protein
MKPAIRKQLTLRSPTARVGIILLVLVLAAALGTQGSFRWLLLLGAAFGGWLLLVKPFLGLVVLIILAQLGPFEFGTGTDVAVNASVVLIPVLLGIWLLEKIMHRKFSLARSRTNSPLMLFLLAGLLSLALGYGLWDPHVPRSSSFIIVQFAQWAIFAFSAGAFWLMGNRVNTQANLMLLTRLYLIVAGVLAILYVIPGIGVFVSGLTTGALSRATFWLLLTGVAAGQLLFNQKLSSAWRLFLVAVLAAVMVFSFYWNRDAASTWLSVMAAVAVLAWLRWPRLRWVAASTVIILAVAGLLAPVIYEFAGGDTEWVVSGGSRLTLITRVVEVTMRNPITGLGPAAYRLYASMEPLPYLRTLWLSPNISSHNNYVDLFSHVGLLGLGLFFWFAAETAALGIRLRARFKTGFAAAYVNGMLAVWVGALVLMLLADWILPFVYNIGFPGFQASVLLWLFLGGLVTLEHLDEPAGENGEP